MRAEIRRLGNRIQDPDWGKDAGERIEAWWTNCRKELKPREVPDSEALARFTTLCQGAAFVARGRDG